MLLVTARHNAQLSIPAYYIHIFQFNRYTLRSLYDIVCDNCPRVSIITLNSNMVEQDIIIVHVINYLNSFTMSMKHKHNVLTFHRYFMWKPMPATEIVLEFSSRIFHDENE